MLIDGKKIADTIQNELKSIIDAYSSRKPCLAVILVGDHPPSQIYVNRKTQACELIGIRSIKVELPAHTTEQELLKKIEAFNQDPTIDGILVQLPLPPHINPTIITHAIDPEKDVDGFHPINVGKLLIGDMSGFIPCTPLGVKILLDRYSIETSGRHVLVVGRSNIVGKPMAALLMQS
jgi:methylenetetrahydrofolate dehydrogenase (NADP+) / methenyltetrahydrofolate cyclohydrolase